MTRIGIEIGGTKQQIVVGDAEGRIIDRCRFSVNPSGGGPAIRERIAEELTPIFVIISTGVALMSLLWKISRVHVEHQRLAMLVSYRRLNGALTGLHTLATHRGTVLLFKNTPLTPAAIRLVPEVIGGVLVAALIPVLGRELQGEVG